MGQHINRDREVPDAVTNGTPVAFVTDQVQKRILFTEIATGG